MEPETPPDCTTCRHFQLLWGAERPRVCNAYGFRSQSYPSIVVRETSGLDCQLYAAKPKPEPSPRAGSPRPR